MRTIQQYGQMACVLGNPIEHTLSPTIHNAAFEEYDMPHRYFALELDKNEIGRFLEVFEELNFLGANLTIPHKEEILNYIDGKTSTVEDIQAANTIFRDNGNLVLENTDVYGFTKLVERWHASIRNGSVVLLGAGGAARACIQAITEIGGKEIQLWNRTKDRARQLKQKNSKIDIRLLSDHDLHEGNFGGRIVVNATSLGLQKGDPSPFPGDQIKTNMIGVDLIYNRETQFLREFRNQECPAVDGLDMLIHQAARSWELWTNADAPVELMEKATRSEISG